MNDFNELEVSEGTEFGKKCLKNMSLMDAFYFANEIRQAFYILNELNVFKPELLLQELGFSNILDNYKKYSIGVIYLESLLSVEPSNFRFHIVHVSQKTKRGNYIHTIKNNFDIEFCLALKEVSSYLKVDPNEKPIYEIFDLDQFVVHPCIASKKNWLFIHSETINDFVCDMCKEKVYKGLDNPIGEGGKPIAQLIPGINFETKFSREEFDTFFKINLQRLSKTLKR